MLDDITERLSRRLRGTFARATIAHYASESVVPGALACAVEPAVVSA